MGDLEVNVDSHLTLVFGIGIGMGRLKHTSTLESHIRISTHPQQGAKFAASQMYTYVSLGMVWSLF